MPNILLTPDNLQTFFKSRLKNIKSKNIHLISSKNETETLILNPHYWDCECEKTFIHKATEFQTAQCPFCKAFEEEQPPSRQNEINIIKNHFTHFPPKKPPSYDEEGWHNVYYL